MHALPQRLERPAPLSMAALGDSLACGLGASSPERGLAHLFHARLRAERPASTLLSFAVPHATMGDVLRHQVPRLRGQAIDLAVLIAGANDLRYTRDVLVITRRFRSLLQAIASAAPQAAIVASGMPDVTRTVAVPRLLKPPVQHLCARLNERMRAIAYARGAGFIDMFAFTNAPLRADAEYLCADGFHPNDFGYAEIAGRAYPHIAALVQRAEDA